MSKYLFSSESVSEGHPDKICDQVSDALLDAYLEKDPESRVAIECLTKTGFITVAGELTSKAQVDIQEVVRKTIKEIGYNTSELGFDGNTCGVLISLSQQSPDIAQGVNSSSSHEQGAGDQGLMFGYATNETPEYMPLSIVMSHSLLKRLSELRRSGVLPYLRPDGKSQVTVEYENDKPKRIHTVVLSAHHAPNVSQEQIKRDLIEKVIEYTCGQWIDDKTIFHINPTGSFLIGGPVADAGLTGRKIIVDSYGGMGRHGGGCFCLVGDALINTEKGLLPLKEMKDCTKDLLVKTDISPTKAELWLDNGEMETLKIVTKDRYEVEGTKNQSFRVIDENGNYIWRRMDELKDSDWIAIQKKNRLFGNGFNADSFSFNHKSGTTRKNSFIFPTKLTEDYANLMGLLIGDGNCMMDGAIAICVCEEEQKTNVQNLYQRLFGRPGKIFGHWAFFGGVELRAYLDHLGLKKQRSWQKEIPKSLFQAEQNVVASFLKGLFDTDGTVRTIGRNNTSPDIRFTTTSSKLAKDVQQLLLNFGITSNIQTVNTINKVSEIKGREVTSRRLLYHLRVKGFYSASIFREKIGFNLSRKSNILNSIDFSAKEDRSIIPNQSERIRRLWNKLPSNIKQADEFKVGRFARSHEGKTTQELTYHKLKEFLDGYAKFFESDLDFEYLRSFFIMNHYYTQIKERVASSAQVYDITVPGAHTFTANGFICHNSGKDASKVDRSAAYAARYIAKNIVAAGLADKCEVQLAYAIGVAEPVSIHVNCFNTNKLPEEMIESLIRKNFPLKPADIISHLKLKRPIFKKTAAYGHFGRNDPDFTWEALDKVDALKRL